MTKSIIIIFFILLPFGITFSQTHPARQAFRIYGENKLEIKLNKTEYYESEPIWLEIYLKISKDLHPQVGPDLTISRFLNLNIYNKKTKVKVKPIMDKGYWLMPDHTKLKISREYFNIIKVQSYYGEIQKFKNAGLLLRNYIPEGEYSLSATTSYWENNEPNTIYSDTLNFIVKKPEGLVENDYSAYLEFITMRQSLLSDLDRSISTHVRDSNLVDTIRKYTLKYENENKNSIYLEPIQDLDEMFSNYYYLPNDDSLINYDLRFIKTYPNNYFMFNALTDIYFRFDTRFYKDKKISDFFEIINDIKNKYKGTLLERFIHYKMDEWKHDIIDKF